MFVAKVADKFILGMDDIYVYDHAVDLKTPHGTTESRRGILSPDARYPLMREQSSGSTRIFGDFAPRTTQDTP
jgi:hypothetical protein